MTAQMKEEITALVENAKTVYVSSVDEAGYPNTKAMLSLQRDGLGVHYFSTNTSSKRVSQFRANPKACVYYCDEPAYHGLMLLGTVEVCTDAYHKELLWREGFECYYPKGVTDDDYCVYKFTAEKGRYYPGSSETFDIAELVQI
ncbi:MAG: pyridoxamine 5'-phosphate oxidase family protein [Firmicutes bacterium]|nr:pyridoxamine 5'-phosphate oxidase family protein [Bacillota bacterium]